jgi:flagellar export protein FliJ
VKRFPFRLASLHAYRKHGEDLAGQALARQLLVAARCREALGDADRAVDSARQSLGGGAMSGPELAARQRFVERRERERIAAARELETQQLVAEERRSELAVATQARTALDKLRDKQYAAHLREQQRAEEAALGELALSRHLRAKAAS